MNYIPLGKLERGAKAVIMMVDEVDKSTTHRLLEMGFVEGSLVCIAHEAPFSRDPIAVEVRGSLVALRRSEADLIKVRMLS